MQANSAVWQFLFTFLAFGIAFGEPTIDPKMMLPDVHRGQPVTISGTDLPGEKENVKIVLITLRQGKSYEAVTESIDAKSFTFRVPQVLPPDRYVVTVQFGSAPALRVSGELRVLEDSEAWVDKVDPIEVVRGSPVTVTGNFPKKPVNITVHLQRMDRQLTALEDPKRVPSGEASALVKDDGTSFVFLVPQHISLGAYAIIATFQGRYESGPAQASQYGPIRVVKKEPVRITTVHPSVSYPDGDAFNFTVLGEGFSPLDEDNELLIDGAMIPVCWVTEFPPKPKPGAARQVEDRCKRGYGKITAVGHQLDFREVSLEKFYAPIQLQMRVGNQVSNAVGLTLSWVSEITPLMIAVGVFLALASVVIFLIRTGFRTAPIAGESYHLLQAFFLDKETNTYSLSKFQFYLWTGTAILGYVYLTASWSLVRGIFEFADIPTNLPGILLISAGTGILAQGISATKGSKGSGEVQPSLSDFITSGGVVAADRFQFFVWTVLGVFTFLALVFLRSPSTIETLPGIPVGFLELMGISSAGYLGGKLARKSGPRIRQIAAWEESLVLEIHGEALSQDATFRIGETEINPKRLDPNKHKDGRPELIVKDDNPGFAKVLRLTILDPDPRWLQGKQELTLTNPDGQWAVWVFDVGKPEVTSIVPSTPQASSASQAMTITGSGFQPGLTLEIRLPNGTVLHLTPQVQSLTTTSFQVQVVLETPGTYASRVINPGKVQSDEFGFTVKSQE